MKSWNVLRQEVFSPLSQYFVELPLAAITASNLLGYLCLYQLCTSGFWDFLPFFLVDLLKLHHVGWERRWTEIFKSFHRFSMGFKSGLWLGHSKDFHILVLKPFQCCFGFMLGVIVLLEHKSSLQFKVFCTLKQVLLKDLPHSSSWQSSFKCPFAISEAPVRQFIVGCGNQIQTRQLQINWASSPLYLTSETNNKI